MDDDGEAEPSFVWEVGDELIDLDHWARSYVAVRVAEKERQLSTFVRIGYLPITALVVLVIGLTSSATRAALMAGFVAVVLVGARLWNRGAAARLATRLHGLPAASEPFTFRADPSGTHSRSASGSEQLTWSRYRSVRIHDDLFVLTHDTDVVRLLPIAGLASDRSADSAVAVIAGWIAAARPRSATAA